MKPLTILAAELTAIVGCISAAVLAFYDKPAIVWCWFLVFGFMNIVTGYKSDKGDASLPPSNTKAAGE